jgi:quercetin dioxygenase-like cupin family protein
MALWRISPNQTEDTTGKLHALKIKRRIIIEFINAKDIKDLSNPGVVSRQLLNPDNSESKRVTITEVHLEIGAEQPRHTHEASEQIWYATKGSGKLLLADDTEKEFKAGDVVRFADKDIHGLKNDGDTEFVYISVTAPPIHFGYAYQNEK